jgi:thioredoxin 1
MLAVGLKNFTQEVMKAKGPILVDFWSPDCAPCRALKPKLEQIEDTGVTVVTVNVNDETELTDHFKIESIPTLIVFKNGKPIQRKVGTKQKDLIEIVNTIGKNMFD